MTTELCRLNDHGTELFMDYINQIAAGDTSSPPFAILTDTNYSEQIDFSVQLDQPSFSTRFEIGEYLKERLEDVNRNQLLGDPGIWNWMALYWFDSLCPAAANGTRKPSKPYNYILSTNYNHRPRHALLTTWLLVDTYGETARFLLSKKPDSRGELLEQIAARQYLISCRGIIEAASRLYYDKDKQTFKRGSTTQTKKGNIRRYISFLQQLELTYDLFTLPCDEIINILPDEYNGFLGDAS